jgi:hypothetical protein
MQKLVLMQLMPLRTLFCVVLVLGLVTILPENDVANAVCAKGINVIIMTNPIVASVSARFFL